MTRTRPACMPLPFPISEVQPKAQVTISEASPVLSTSADNTSVEANCRILLYCNDMSEGGIAHYLTNLTKVINSNLHADATKRTIISDLVFCGTFRIDPSAITSIAKYLALVGGKVYCSFPDASYRDYIPENVIHEIPQTTEALDQLIAARGINVITATGVNPEWTPLPAGFNEWLANLSIPFYPQAHGCCPWTRKVIEYGQIYATGFIACSLLAENFIKTIVPDSMPVITISTSIDLARLLVPNTTAIPVVPVNNKSTFTSLDVRQYTYERRKLFLSQKYSTENLGIDDVWVLFYGRYAPEKRIPRIAEVIKEANAQSGGHIKFTGIFAGEGYWAEQTRKELNAILTLGYDFYDFTWQKPSDMLSCSDVFMCLSEAEGIPVTAIESLAAGLFIVSYDVGIFAEELKQGRFLSPHIRILPNNSSVPVVASQLLSLFWDDTLRQYMSSVKAFQSRFSESALAVLAGQALSNLTPV